jgi:hypothetical protein
MRALFIGGPWDGRLVEHKLKIPTFRVRECIAPSVTFDPLLSQGYRRPSSIYGDL